MTRSKRTIRASEISTFIFCQRAWWYQRNNIETMNTPDLVNGVDFHKDHWIKTNSYHFLRKSACGLLLVAFALFIISLT